METIHPGAWFPAGRPLPAPGAPPSDDGKAAPASATETGAIPAGIAGRDLLEGAAALRGRMAWDAAVALAARAAEEAGDPAERAEALNEQACAFLLAGETGAAGEACGRVPGDSIPRAQRARTLVNRAVLAGLGGDAAGALARLDEAEAALEGTGDGWERLLVGVNRAAALARRGEHDTAERAAADALRLARRVRSEEEWIAVGLMATGVAALGRARRADARARLGDAVRAFARVGDALRQVQGHFLLGEIAYGGEDPIRAGTHYRDGLAVARGVEAHGAVELLTLRFEHR